MYSWDRDAPHAYNGAMYCGECADKARADIAKNELLQMEAAHYHGQDWENIADTETVESLTRQWLEETGSSEDWPQAPVPFAEHLCNVPSHCGDCGELLDVQLTDEGRQYVAGRIAEHIADKRRGSAELLALWAAEFDIELTEVLNAAERE